MIEPRTLCALAAALLLASGVMPAPAQSAAPVRWKHVRTVDELSEPFGAQLLDDGTLIVLERGRGRVTLVPQNEARRFSWGDTGIGPGQLAYPEGFALGERNEVFIADTCNQRVQVFSLQGRYQRAWGRWGSGEGEFNRPGAIAVFGERVYVADTGNDRVQEFDTQGKWRATLGGFGAAPGRMNRPAAVDVSDSGELFVADRGNHRIQRFSSAGELLGQWGEYGYVPGLLADPTDVFAWQADVFVADLRNHRVQVFDPAGRLRQQWGLHAILPRQGEGYLHYPNRVALSRDGKFAVVCEDFEDRCQIFARQEGPAPPDELPPLPPSEAAPNHYGAHASVSGNLLALTSPDTSQILIFDADRDVPILINSFGSFGRAAGQFGEVGAVSLDLSRGDLYVCDSGNRRLVRLVLDYKPGDALKMLPEMTRFASAVEYEELRSRAPAGLLKLPIDVVALRRGGDGRLYLLDAANCVLLVYSAELQFERSLGGRGPAPGQLLLPTDFALAADGTTYVVDALLALVNVFDSGGKSLGVWGKRGSDAGELARPRGIALSPSGDGVYLTDELTQRVQRFSRAGRYERGWGRHGVAGGQFLRPTAIALDPRGNLLVIDQGNHRGQILQPDGKFLRAFGSRWFVDPTRKRGARP